MAMLQGNTYQVPVQVTDCRGEVMVPSMVERGQFVFGSLEKFYGGGGEVWWNDELQAFMIPLAEEETFGLKGAVKYQARLLLKDGSISGTIPQSEYIRESITDVRLSEGGAGIQSGSILKASILKEVASVISDVVVDQELDAGSENAISNGAVTNAINKVEAIAKGAQQAVAYKTYQEAVTAINGLGADVYSVGQNVMIFTLSVPDLWVSGVEETREPYEYVGDEAIVNALKADGSIRVGHYTLSALETGKVNLEDYYTKSETDVLLGNIPIGIEQLVGTEDKPINFATDMEVGKLYIITGDIKYSEKKSYPSLSHQLCFKCSSSNIIIYNCMFSNSAFRGASGATLSVGFDSSTGYVSSTSHYTGIYYFNGQNPASNPPMFYAPTSSGTAGQILKSNGVKNAPAWVTPNFATIDDITNAINGMWEESY
jgi:hypothetical protein